jgi:hypothetical protein
MEMVHRFWILFLLLLFVFGALSSVNIVSATRPPAAPTPQPTLIPHVATADELQAAQAQWARSRHANTYDNGQGANTTCASCKSPRNWDPRSGCCSSGRACVCMSGGSAQRVELQQPPDSQAIL